MSGIYAEKSKQMIVSHCGYVDNFFISLCYKEIFLKLSTLALIIFNILKILQNEMELTFVYEILYILRINFT